MQDKLSLIMIFTAGAASFLSPCTLAIMPAYIGYFAASDKKNGILMKALGFVIGFSIVFILMGATATAISKVFLNNQVLFRRLAGAVIFLFGLHLLGIIRVNGLLKEKRFLNLQNERYWASSVLLGIAFGLGWTPCVGQILGPVLLYAGNTMSVKLGILYLFIYSLGLATPLIIFALFYEKYIYKLSKISKFTIYVEKTAGVILILTGILIFQNYLGRISQFFNI